MDNINVKNINVKNIDFNNVNNLLDEGYSKTDIVMLRRYGQKTASNVINDIINNEHLYLKTIKPINNSINVNLEYLCDEYHEILLKYLNIHIYNGFIPEEILSKIKIIIQTQKKIFGKVNK